MKNISKLLEGSNFYIFRVRKDFQTRYKKKKKQVIKKKIDKFDYIVINNFYKKKKKKTQAKSEGKLQTMKASKDICDPYKWERMKI